MMILRIFSHDLKLIVKSNSDSEPINVKTLVF